MEKPSLLARFFSFLLKVLVVLVLMVLIAAGSFEGVTYYLTGSFYDLRKMAKESADTITKMEEKTEETKIDDDKMRNTLLFVEDENTGRQYVTLNMMNKENYAMDIVLIPENAQVTVGKEVLKEIQRVLPDAKKTLMFAEIFRSFGEDKYEMAEKVIENIMGITISGYDVMTTENLKKFLDMVDSVSYTFSGDWSYRDAKGVLQHVEADTDALDSTQGMALLTYTDGTQRQESARLERVSTYLQSFLTALLEENSASTVCKKYKNLVQSGGDRDTSQEETLIKNLAKEPATIRILQGAETGGVFVVDGQKAKLQIAMLIKQTEGNGASGTTKKASSQTSSAKGDSREEAIELYNSAYVAGLAAKWEAYLEEEDYNISLVDSYQEEGPLSVTRIVVTEDGMGEDLLQYFPDATIEVGRIDTGGDIQVYIGTDSIEVGGAAKETETEDEEEGKEEEDSSEEKEEKPSGGSYRYDLDSASE